jgi:hypothetical protein
MIQTSKTTAAEMQLQAEMDSARLAYEDSLAMVRGDYFRKIELLHNKLAKDQQAAVDRYHDGARAELSQIIKGLGSALADIEVTEAPVKILSADTFETVALKQSSFFAPDEPVKIELEPWRNPFRRGRHRP